MSLTLLFLLSRTKGGLVSLLSLRLSSASSISIGLVLFAHFSLLKLPLKLYFVWSYHALTTVIPCSLVYPFQLSNLSNKLKIQQLVSFLKRESQTTSLPSYHLFIDFPSHKEFSSNFLFLFSKLLTILLHNTFLISSINISHRAHSVIVQIPRSLLYLAHSV